MAVGIPWRCWGGVARAAVVGGGREEERPRQWPAALAGRQWLNAHTAALLWQEVGGGCDAVLVGRWWGVFGGER